MIELTEQEFEVFLDDFNRLDDGERAAVLESLKGYFNSNRDAWSINCSAATAILMDFITYMLDGRGGHRAS